MGGLSLGLADSASLMGLAIGVGGLLAVFAPRFRTVAAVVLGLAALPRGRHRQPAARRTRSQRAAGRSPCTSCSRWALPACSRSRRSSSSCSRLQDSALRSGRTVGWLATLPPVESLERALFSVIAIGTAALTVAILAGLLFVTDLFAQHLIHKTVLALVAWAIFACLLFGRWRFGWRGRKAARYTIAGFVVLALAYFGSKFVLEILLGRHWG